MKEIELLWLYYDYLTEMFDRSLPHKMSPRGEAMVRRDYTPISNQYARRIYGFIMRVAEFQGVSFNEMKRFREHAHCKRVGLMIEEYEYIRKHHPELYRFVDDYVDLEAFADSRVSKLLSNVFTDEEGESEK